MPLAVQQRSELLPVDHLPVDLLTICHTCAALQLGPAFTFTSKAGSAACEPCPTGLQSSASATSCLVSASSPFACDCFVCSTERQMKAVQVIFNPCLQSTIGDCPLGTVRGTDGQGDTSCVPCPAGTSRPPGVADCQVSRLHLYSTNSASLGIPSLKFLF